MTQFDFIGYALPDICRSIGLLGFVTYVANYACLSLRVFTSEHITYFSLNIVAATCVLVSLTQDFNLASALIQSFWIVMGGVAVALRIRKRTRERRAILALLDRGHGAVGDAEAPIRPVAEELPVGRQGERA